MNISKIKSFVIVGGGTAGWLAALYLRKFCAERRLRRKITVVESPIQPIVGVGEGTLDRLPNFLRELDVDIPEFMRECEASFKNGFRFRGWSAHRGGEYYHPFFSEAVDATYQLKAVKLGIPVSELCLSTYLCRSLRSPYPADGGEPASHGFHFDTFKVGAYLKRLAPKRGVEHVIGHVQEQVYKDGRLRSLVLDGGRTLSGDLFLDCSGFKSLLIGKAPGARWHSYRDTLLVDTALALGLPYGPDKSSEILPYTTSTAMKAGWAWRIPLYTWLKHGYVFSRRYLSPADAEAEYRRHLGISGDVPMQRIDMNVGHFEQSFIGSCAAIGLSGGFIEPLESSGIALITSGLTYLGEYLAGRDEGRLRRAFNERINNQYEWTKNFIFLHYALSDRRDTPFWRAWADLPWPEGAASVAELFGRLDYGDPRQIEAVQYRDLGYSLMSYISVMDGMGFFQRRPRALARLKVERGDRALLEGYKGHLEEMARGYKTVTETLDGYRAELAARPSR